MSGRLTKPDLGGGISHPARYNKAILDLFESWIPRGACVLDPFAGTGRIHDLARETVGVELEPEWAALRDGTICADARHLPFPDATFDVVATSPTFGNRLADHHEAKDASLRRSYAHDLGRRLTPGNSGEMHWGDEYRELHAEVWAEVRRVLKPDGLFLVELKNHIRGGVEQQVREWHDRTIRELGFIDLARQPLGVRHLRQGANTKRCPAFVYVYRAPGDGFWRR